MRSCPTNVCWLERKKRRPVRADFQIWEVHFRPWEISHLTLWLQKRSDLKKGEDLTVLEQTTQSTHKHLYSCLPSESRWKKLPQGLNLLNRSRLYYKTITSSLYREKYTKSQRVSPMFSSGAEIFGHVSHSTELVRMCLACQHFDFNSADWISDNLHVISSWYLQTMGKEFIFQFSRRSWGRNAWRTSKNVCVGG